MFMPEERDASQPSPVIKTTYFSISGDLSDGVLVNSPLVSTPSIVDLPLSTFPTTAHRTSGMRDTSGGGNRSNTEARGRGSLARNKVQA
jgi:hypothetical protein